MSANASFARAKRRMLVATMFCYLFYYTGRQTFGFAVPGIERDLGLAKDVLGWVSAALLWSYALGQSIHGNLGDKFGGRIMMSLGAGLSFLLNWVTSFAASLLSLALPWSMNGFVQAMGWAPGSRLISNWWQAHERGIAFGFYVFAAGLASVLSFVTSLVVLQVFELDWRWIFRLPVLLLLGAGLVYFLVARNRPEDMGFSSGTKGSPSHVGEKDHEERTTTSWNRYATALGNWRFMLASLAIGLQNAARYGLLVWVPVHYLGEEFKTTPGGAWISVVLPVGMACGALSNGWISDRYCGSRRSGIITVYLSLAGLVALLMYFLPQHSWWGMLCLFLCGFFVYGPQSGFWALAPDLLGRQNSGTGVGVMNAVAYGVAGLGEPLIGYLIRHSARPVEILDPAGQLSVVFQENTALVFFLVSGFAFAGAVLAKFVNR